MKRISEVIGKYMAWIVLIIAALAQLSVDDRYVRHGTDDEAV